MALVEAPKEEAPDERLSYSSSTLLKNCEQKYCYYKIDKAPKDSDVSDSTEAFDIGKAFHQVLEDNNHTDVSLEGHLDNACRALEVEAHKGMIHAMLLRYLQVHAKSGLEVVRCELGLNNPKFIGYIDVILKDPKTGEWWIADLKTAGRYSPITTAKLANDVQLNLYCSFAEHIAAALELDVKKFMGARYRVTTKSKLKRKVGESYGAHVRRTAKNVVSYDIIVPIAEMSPAAVYKEHLKLQAKTVKFRKGTLKPTRNLSYCDSFFRSCDYFSRCHGKNFTEAQDQFEMLTSDNV